VNIPPLPDQFLLYLRQWDASANKWAKYPCNPAGQRVNAHDPAQWMSAAQASQHALWDEAQPHKPYGLAFDLTPTDPWFFLDLDHCLVDGVWTADATAMFTSFNGAWGEVSSSGDGLHIIGKCDPSKLQDRKHKWQENTREFYTENRFIAFSKAGWAPIGGEARPDMDWTDQLRHIVPERANLGELPDGVDPAYTGPEDDDALLRMMLATGGAGAAFGLKVSPKHLWEADATVLARAYPAYDGQGGFDHSSADASLMAHLAFWTGRDMPRMDRLFRMSALMRDKYATRAQYRTDTIGNASRLCKKVYDRPRAKERVAGEGGAPEVYLTVPEMIKHFEGCTYIRDIHKIMVPGGMMLKPEQFNAWYGGHMFQMMPDGTQPSKKAFEALTESRAHHFTAAIRPCFRPDLAEGLLMNDGSINTYYKPDVTMTEGDITPFMDFMAKLIPDEGDRHILLSYMAAVVQHPGVKFQWAPVLQGAEGNGKTMCASVVAYAVGNHYTHMPNSKQLGEKFNAYLEGKVFIVVEEIDMQGKREMLDILKPLITNTSIEIRGMQQEKRMAENRANWMFCTNFQDAVTKSRNDRRYSIFFTGQQSADDLRRDGMDGDYFPDMWSWLHGDGYSHVAHYLTHMKIDPALDPSGACHRAPRTTSTDAAIERSGGVVEAEIMEATQDNTAGFRGGWVSSYCLEGLMKHLGIRINRNKLADIMVELGYVRWGRAPKSIFREDSKRPTLYTTHKDATFEDYLTAQHYMETTT